MFTWQIKLREFVVDAVPDCFFFLSLIMEDIVHVMHNNRGLVCILNGIYNIFTVPFLR